MKSLIVFALFVAGTTALHIPEEKLDQKNPPTKHDGRITGGENADIRKFNYQVGLATLTWKGDNYTIGLCGGSLIAHNWVLTAAHCTIGINKTLVMLGSANFTEGPVNFTVEHSTNNIIEHELWNNETYVNDIALIRIPTVKYTKYIIPVHLAKPVMDDSIWVNKNVIASGWGSLGDNNIGDPPLLQWATMRIISNKECSESYSNIIDGHICVATNTDSVMRSPCSGDSGGPLVLSGTNIQIGLTSYVGDEGCAVGSPTVFTRVSFYLDWIVASTGISF